MKDSGVVVGGVVCLSFLSLCGGFACGQEKEDEHVTEQQGLLVTNEIALPEVTGIASRTFS